MDAWSPHTYRKQGERAGRDPAVVAAALQQAMAQQAKGIPPILTLNHLSFHTDVPCRYLRDCVRRAIDPYRVFRIRKRSGGHRIIVVADQRLRRIQRWLNKYVLQAGKVHHCSFAYASGSSPARCAQMHLGCRWLVKVDIRQFFESISEIQAYHVFRSLGYEPLVAFELSRLATRLADSVTRYEKPQWQQRDPNGYSIGAYRNLKIGHLPQGAATSPMLANLAMVKCDHKLEQLAIEEGTTYTRYSDDLCFSTDLSDFTWHRAKRLVGRAYAVLNRSGLRPRTAKTTIVPPGARKIVLGLLVDGDRVRLTRQFRRKLECHVHHVSKHGPEAHARRRRPQRRRN